MASENAPANPQPFRQGAQERRLIPGSAVYGTKGCTTLSRTSVWRGVREGWFPSPVSISPGRVAWFEDEVATWLNSRPRLRLTGDDARRRERLLPQPRRN
jgi:predicted DNA-binding transcriptional regulator AlpA